MPYVPPVEPARAMVDAGQSKVLDEIPTVLGNLVGGVVFVGLALYITHARTQPTHAIGAPDSDRAAASARTPEPA